MIDLAREREELRAVDDDVCDRDDEAGPPSPPAPSTFSVRTELGEMASLGVPLTISFFCRFGMASTDSAFVGHIRDDEESGAFRFEYGKQ